MYNPFLGLYIAATLALIMLCFIYCLGKSKLRNCVNNVRLSKRDQAQSNTMETSVARDTRVTFASSNHESHAFLNINCIDRPNDTQSCSHALNKYTDNVTYKVEHKPQKAKLLLEGDLKVHILEINPDCPLHGVG